MSCSGRIPTIQEYCALRLNNVPYNSDVKPDYCYNREIGEDGKPVSSLDGVDWGVIGGYFLVVLGTGLGISFFQRKDFYRSYFLKTYVEIYSKVKLNRRIRLLIFYLLVDQCGSCQWPFHFFHLILEAHTSLD